MLIIGSVALRLTNLDYLCDDIFSKDLDIIGTIDDYNDLLKKCRPFVTSSFPVNENKFVIFLRNGCPETLSYNIVEFEIAWSNTSAKSLLDLVDKHNLSASYIVNDAVQYNVATLPVLYALKMSHRYLRNNPHFVKTMSSIKKMRTIHPTEIEPNLKDWFKERERETYSYGHPNLKQSKANFFKDDNVPYIFDHDSIHEAVKHFDKPAYTYFKEYHADVACSEKMFNSISETYKLHAVLEESYVLALERSLIPNEFAHNPFDVFKVALEKVCTSITSGWFREYSWEHYNEVLNMYNESFVTRFKKGLVDGVVKEHSNAT